jgi:hypothetical protein
MRNWISIEAHDVRTTGAGHSAVLGVLIAAAMTAVTAGCGGRSDNEVRATGPSGADDETRRRDAGAEPMSTDDESADAGDPDGDPDDAPADDPDEVDVKPPPAPQEDPPNDTDEDEDPSRPADDAKDDTNDDTVAIDAGVPMDNEPVVVPPPEPDVVNPSDPVWVFISTPSRSLINVNDPNQRFSDLSIFYEAQGGVAPWSSDGRLLANVEGEMLRFYDLRDGSLVSETPAGGVPQVLRWSGNEGVLIRSSSDDGQRTVYVTTTGSEMEVVPPTTDLGLATHSASPDGTAFLYSVAGGPEGYPFFFVDMSNPAMPGPETLLGTHPMSPALSHIWSSDSRWVAYGVSGAVSGIYLWSPSSGQDPIQISPEGTSYTPLHAFSPNADGIASFVSGTDGSVLVHAAIGETVGTVTQLSTAPDQSPAIWSPDGAFLSYSSEETGWLHPIGAGGAVGTRFELPEYNYGCRLAWTSASEFIYTSCTAALPELRWGEVASDVTTTPLGVGDSTAFAVGGACLVAWNAETLQVGMAAMSPSLASVPSPIAPIERVSVDPAGAGVVWTVRGSLFYWQPLQDCTPVGSPVLIDGVNDIQQIEFAPR